MKSQKKQSTNKTDSLNLVFEISAENGEFIKRLEKVVATQKLPKKRNN